MNDCGIAVMTVGVGVQSRRGIYTHSPGVAAIVGRDTKPEFRSLTLLNLGT